MNEGWEPVKVTDMMEAEVLKAALETAEIPVVLRGETAGRIYGITATELGNVFVLVPADRVEEARALIEDSRPINFPDEDIDSAS